MRESQLLKKDLFGEVRRMDRATGPLIVRDAASARPPLRWLARWLMRREAAVLAALGDLPGVPGLLGLGRDRLERSYLDGLPLQQARPGDADYHRRALRLLRQLHARNVVHNDLAKEPNILVTRNGAPAFVDFQLAWHAPRRGRAFRVLAYDDLRHLLKHKRTYCAAALTRRQLDILARPSLPSRLIRSTIKPPYLFVTRRLLGWADREGAADRGAQR